MYEIFSENPGRGRRFAGAMESYTKGPGFSMSHVTDGFPWKEIGSGTVVDVSPHAPFSESIY